MGAFSRVAYNAYMTSRTKSKLWVVWGLRRGYHPMEAGAWHPLFHCAGPRSAERIAVQAAHVEHKCKMHEPWMREDKRHDCQKCKYSEGVWLYERFKACPPERPPVNPAKVRPTRKRRPCGRCGTTWLPKVWREKRRCEVCGWVPPPFRQQRAAA